jgi:hypothetical protein
MPLLTSSGSRLITHRPAAATFLPSDLANLQMWYKADALALTDGAMVASWTDSSGNSRHATQAADAKKPLYKTAIQNGKPVVRFDATDDTLAITATIASGSWSIYAVHSGPGTAVNGRYILDTQSGRLIVAVRTANGVSDTTIGWYDGGWKTVAAGTTGFQINSWILTSGGNGEIFRNGTSLGTAAYSAKGIGGAIALGTRYDGTGPFFGADMGEVIFYNAAHNATQRGQVQSYLSTRWGIALA